MWRLFPILLVKKVVPPYLLYCMEESEEFFGCKMATLAAVFVEEFFDFGTNAQSFEENSKFIVI